MTCSTYRVDGMSCASCARAIERSVAQQNGVLDAVVNYATRTLTVHWDAQRVTASEVVASVEEAGYHIAREDEDVEASSRKLKIRLAVTAFFSMQAMLPSLALWIDGTGDDVSTRWWLALASGVLSLPAILYGGWPFYARALHSLRSRAPGMDLLVSLGALSAFGYSVVALASGSDRTWFDTATAIVFFLLVGRVIEDFARRRGLDAVRALSSLAPATARVIDDVILERATESVREGELVRVLPGERAPVDGVVVHGVARVDRALLTGESPPVLRAEGERVEAATLVLDGALDLRGTGATGARALDRIVQATDALLEKRAPLQGLADRVASQLVSVVLAVAALTAVIVGLRTGSFSTGLLRAIAVTVIACPCALGLAVPMAVLVAAGRAARRGILFRDAASIERAAEVDAVFFDKTGTLTEGRPRVVAVLPAPGVDAREVSEVAAIAEAGSSHPIARALSSPDVISGGITRTIPGEGVVVEGEARTVVGSATLLAREGLAVDESHPGTLVHVARDGRFVGTIVLDDRLRDDARDAVSTLRRGGLALGILSGDREDVVSAVAAEVGIDRAHGGLSPLEKAAVIARTRAHVAFVGDGLNDAPALAAAYLGVAADGATDVAQATAHIAIRDGGVARVVEALELARRTRRTMRGNVAWAIAYNAIAIPLAAAGAVRPELAALAMAASSISVIASSLRLARA